MTSSSNTKPWVWPYVCSVFACIRPIINRTQEGERMEYMRYLFPDLEGLVKEALRKGLPMPENWGNRWTEEDLQKEIAAENKAATDSIQGPDDPDEKEVREDCGSQTTEDCHGGDEATRSVEDSPSVAENGQEDRDSDQTSNGGEEGEGEGEDGQAGETTHSSDSGKDSGEGGEGTDTDDSEESDKQQSESDESSSDSTSSDKNGTDSATEENQDTSEQKSDDEVETKDTTEVNTRLARLQASLGLLEQNTTAEMRYNMETPEEKRVMQNIYDCIVEICKSSCNGVKNQQTKWDTRAMARDIVCFRRDRVLRDKHWSYKPRKLAIFWDQSGSCDFYFAAVANAIKEVAKIGYKCWLYDCSNGLAYKESIVAHIVPGTRGTTVDAYQNGPRLKKLAREVGAETDKIYIQPNQADFIKICQGFDVVIVIQDYDYVESVWLAAKRLPAAKCPHYIDIDSRYNHPCEHSWNPTLTATSDYPVHDRWHKVVEVTGDE